MGECCGKKPRTSTRQKRPELDISKNSLQCVFTEDFHFYAYKGSIDSKTEDYRNLVKPIDIERETRSKKSNITSTKCSHLSVLENFSKRVPLCTRKALNIIYPITRYARVHPCVTVYSIAIFIYEP